MEMKTINARLLAKAFLGASTNLDNHKEWINELNVFPVPDGDTGTNMTATIASAAHAVEELGSEAAMKDICKAISSGSLRGARGNSGVILSQLFRGFCKISRDYSELNVQILCEAMQRACETAYKAVMKPKEGTILTVARAAADKALEMAAQTDDVLVFSDAVIKEAERVLAQTPDMLPVLKQAGVVDSGGQGLVEVLKGAFIVLSGGQVEAKAVEIQTEAAYAYRLRFKVVSAMLVTGDQVSDLRHKIMKGRECQVTGNANSISVEIECDDPGQVISIAMDYGVLHQVHLHSNPNSKAVQAREGKEALTEQTSSERAEEKEKESSCSESSAESTKEIAFVAVSVGEGMNDVFRQLGCDHIITGGQTMNPSTEDILSAIEKTNARNIIVLPNNKNIIMAAKQAADLTEGKRVVVIPTKTVPQGITAMINFIPDQSLEDNQNRMMEEIALVKTGQITYAVRDTLIDNKQIHQGDFMGIGDDGIISVDADLSRAFHQMIDAMVDEESSIISIYFGQDASEEDANALAEQTRQRHPQVEVEVQNGGQPVYCYVVSVE